MSKLTKRILRDYGQHVHDAHVVLKNEMLEELRPLMARSDFGAIVSQTMALVERPDVIPVAAWPTILSSIAGFLNSENSAKVKKMGRKIPIPLDRPRPPRKFSVRTKPNRNTQANRQSYESYINSNEWKRKRLALFQRRGRKCESCGETRGEIHVHHLTYANFGKEQDIDLLILCRECHMMRHRK